MLAALPSNDRNIIRNKAYEMRDIANAGYARASSLKRTNKPGLRRWRSISPMQRRLTKSHHDFRYGCQYHRNIIATLCAFRPMRNLTFIGNFNIRTASGTVEAPLVQMRFFCWLSSTMFLPSCCPASTRCRRIVGNERSRSV